MKTEFEPILAEALKTDKDFQSLRFPLIATPKLDGIRVLKRDGKLLTRSNKLVRNRYIQSKASEIPDGLDGEIMTFTEGTLDAFSPSADAVQSWYESGQSTLDAFDTISSKVMSGDGEPDFKFFCFDDFTYPTMAYVDRLKICKTKVEQSVWCEYVETAVVNDLQELMALNEEHLKRLHGEGTMLRAPLGPYKYGRSSVREGYLLKLKKFEDDEAEVIGINQLFSNTNEVEVNEAGKNFRRSKKENMVPVEKMGSIVVKWRDTTFEIGTGFDDEQRKWWWENAETLIGTSVTFKYQGVGAKGRPRFPVFVGIRRDL
jgi:DNA ligase-1